MSELTPQDIYLFKQGTYLRAYEKLGAHLRVQEGRSGTHFAVWAPDAEVVSVVGDFNGWNPSQHRMQPRWDQSGIWELFVPDVGPGTLYKYHIRSHANGYTVQKTDPYGFRAETPPRTASLVSQLDYEWQSRHWLEQRAKVHALDAPWSIYEVHLGSWRRKPEQGNRWLTYRELAQELGDYAVDMGFTHVELLPVMEHPFFGSLGYQVTGFFAPSSRYGSPQDFMYLIDQLH